LFYRLFFSHRARRAYLALLLGVAALSIGLRVRTYLLTRKIQAVLLSLEQVQVDVTTEEQLLRTVPYLIQQPNPHAYLAEITNGDDRKWIYRLPSFLFYLWPPHTGDGQPIDKWTAMDFPTRVAYSSAGGICPSQPRFLPQVERCPGCNTPLSQTFFLGFRWAISYTLERRTGLCSQADQCQWIAPARGAPISGSERSPANSLGLRVRISRLQLRTHRLRHVTWWLTCFKRI